MNIDMDDRTDVLSESNQIPKTTFRVMPFTFTGSSRSGRITGRSGRSQKSGYFCEGVDWEGPTGNLQDAAHDLHLELVDCTGANAQTRHAVHLTRPTV